jgi:ribosomal protein L21E
MTQRIGTARRKTRHKMHKHRSEKGKLYSTKYMQSFAEGQRVLLTVDSAYQNGMYHPRFIGKSGIIAGKQGNCYKVDIAEANHTKTLIVHPVHLKSA